MLKRTIFTFIITGLLLTLTLFCLNFELNLAKPALIFARVFIIAAAATYLLSLNGHNYWRLIIQSIIFGSITAMMWIYPAPGSLNSLLIITSIFALHCFNWVSYRHGLRTPYNHYFLAFWDSVCLLLCTFLFTLAAWLILMLWGGLFAAIDVKFFIHLFLSDRFAWSVTPIIAVAGLYLTRLHGNIIAYLRAFLLGMGKILLPILTIIGLIYLAYLLINNRINQLSSINLEGVYTTLIGFVAIGIIVINTIYRDGRKVDQLARVIRWSADALIVIMLMMSMVTLLCIFKHFNTPWQVETLSLLLIASLLLFYSISYLIDLFSNKAWIAHLRQVNLILAVLIILVAISINNPLFKAFAPTKKAPLMIRTQPIRLLK